MANITMKITQAYLDKAELNYDVLEEKELKNALVLHLSSESVSQINIIVAFEDDGSSCRMQTYRLISIPKEKREVMLKMCNDLNEKMYFVKFFISEIDDGSLYLTLNDDAVLQPENSGEEVMRCVGQIIGTIDMVYPTIMKVLYA